MILGRLAGAIRRRALPIAALGLLGTVTGVGYGIAGPAEYEATAQLFVTAARTADGQLPPAELATTEARVRSYARLATSDEVLRTITTQLRLPYSTTDLAARISAEVSPGTLTIDVRARDDDPERARALARAVAQKLPDTAHRLANLDRTGASQDIPVAITVTSEARASADPLRPGLLVSTGIGLAAGLLAGLVLAVAGLVGDHRVNRRADLTGIVDRPVLAEIPLQSGRLLAAFTGQDRSTGYAESFRRLRSHLPLTSVGTGDGSLLVTSAAPGEGRTTTAVNLAVSLAHTGVEVVLIDADLHGRGVAAALALDPDQPGLTSVLTGDTELDEALRPCAQGLGLRVITAGPVVANPGDLLATPRMAWLLRTLVSDGMTVVLDSPALESVADAVTLARLCESSVLTAHCGLTRVASLRAAVTELAATGTSVLGVVLIAVPRAGTRRRASSGRGTRTALRLPRLGRGRSGQVPDAGRAHRATPSAPMGAAAPAGAPVAEPVQDWTVTTPNGWAPGDTLAGAVSVMDRAAGSHPDGSSSEPFSSPASSPSSPTEPSYSPEPIFATISAALPPQPPSIDPAGVPAPRQPSTAWAADQADQWTARPSTGADAPWVAPPASGLPVVPEPIHRSDGPEIPDTPNVGLPMAHDVIAPAWSPGEDETDDRSPIAEYWVRAHQEDDDPDWNAQPAPEDSPAPAGGSPEPISLPDDEPDGAAHELWRDVDDAFAQGPAPDPAQSDELDQQRWPVADTEPWGVSRHSPTPPNPLFTPQTRFDPPADELPATQLPAPPPLPTQFTASPPISPAVPPTAPVVAAAVGNPPPAPSVEPPAVASAPYQAVFPPGYPVVPPQSPTATAVPRQPGSYQPAVDQPGRHQPESTETVTAWAAPSAPPAWAAGSPEPPSLGYGAAAGQGLPTTPAASGYGYEFTEGQVVETPTPWAEPPVPRGAHRLEAADLSTIPLDAARAMDITPAKRRR
ncbi:MAG: P-loop NTPase [Kineosporiaceae bacterium]|nr:P-loop NTPase [Kineosporiaceae bacterium]